RTSADPNCREEPPSTSVLVPLRTTGTRSPIFCIHAVNGEVYSYRMLARRLGSEQPVYGLQSRGLDVNEEPLTRIQDMANAYLREVRRIKARGPYTLLAHSMGSLIACEMARDLRSAGEWIDLLAIVDYYPLQAGVPTLAQAFQAQGLDASLIPADSDAC